MEPKLMSFGTSAKVFAKSPLGIIALFIVLIYGMASMVLTFNENLEYQVIPLVYFLVFFPIIVFLGFLWLVARHHSKLYGPSDFKDEDNFMKMQISTAISLTAATMNQQTNLSGNENSQNQFENITDIVTTSNSISRLRKNSKTILWVDDRPENNIYVRKAFEAQGLQVSLALSTNEAISLLEIYTYNVIISDMGRKEGAQEGYVLLEMVRKMGVRTPFY
ncbi:MAG TPA: response regulator, partial [Bacteroidales bacterium]|nr:response regulator [Bacteroidales bacterium]